MDEEDIPPSIEIPDLKKKAVQKEKERKGAGAVGGGAQASGEAGLAGGSSAESGASALLRGGSSPVGAVRGGFVNLLRSRFAALASGKVAGLPAALLSGKGALSMALALGLAGAAAFAVVRGVATRTPAGQRTAARFDALVSTIVPPQKKGVSGGSSLSMLADAAKGLFGSLVSAAKEEGKQADEWSGEKAAPDSSDMVKGVTDGVAGMAREKGGLGEMPGSKLSSELGRSNAFGSRNVFQGGDTGFHAKQLDTSLNPAAAGRGLDSSRGKQARGNLGSMRRGMMANRLSGINTRSHLTDKALGQLKFANAMSYKGAQSGGTEAGSNYAADAFSGQSTAGGGAGQIGGGVGDVGGGVDPGGTGSTSDGTTNTNTTTPCPSGTTATSNGTCEPDDVSGGNVSPDQSLIDMCYGLTMAGIILIMVGAIIVQICQGKAYLELLAMIGRLMVIAGILMGVAVLLMATQMQDKGYMIEWAALGAAMIAAGITGLVGGTTAIIIMEVIMACALIYLGISKDKVETKDNVDQEDVTTTTSRSTHQFADLA